MSNKHAKPEVQLRDFYLHPRAKLSISDDDLCSSCAHCRYRPGELSACQLGWPFNKVDAGDQIVGCIKHQPVPMGSNLVTDDEV